jgi:hypothetical protein
VQYHDSPSAGVRARRDDDKEADKKAEAEGEEAEEGGAQSPVASGGVPLPVRPSSSDYLISSRRKFEVTDLFHTFIGPRSPRVYAFIVGLYLYGSLWAYTSVFAKSFGQNVPSGLRGGEACSMFDGCDGPMKLWTAVFALVVVPLTCMDLREQVCWQVLMFLARILVVALLVITVLAGYACDGVVFAEVPPGHTPKGIALADPNGLGAIFPVAIFAFIFHHSTPVLAQPIRDKKSVNRVFMAAFVICAVAYVLLGLVVGSYFGQGIDSQCNLAWRNYVGCMSPPPGYSPDNLATDAGGNGPSQKLLLGMDISRTGIPQLAQRILHVFVNALVQATSPAAAADPSAAFVGAGMGGAPPNATCTSPATWVTKEVDGGPPLCVDVSARPPIALFVRYLVVLFPAFDVLSAFPLNAITLGNNILSAALGEAALASPSDAEEVAAALIEDEEERRALAGVPKVAVSSRARDSGPFSMLLRMCLRRPRMAASAAAAKGSSDEEFVESDSLLPRTGAARSGKGCLNGDHTPDDDTVLSTTSVPAAESASSRDAAATDATKRRRDLGPAYDAAMARPWYLRTKQGHFVVRTVFRLIAAVPPIAGSLLVSDLGSILQVTGLVGVAIGLVIPALLRLAASAKVRSAFALVNIRLTQAALAASEGSVAAQAAARDRERIASTLSSVAQALAQAPTMAYHGAKTDADAAVSGKAISHEESVRAIVKEARAIRVGWKEMFTAWAPVDRLFLTPYSPWFVKQGGRMVEAIIVGSLAVGVYVCYAVVREIVKSA